MLRLVLAVLFRAGAIKVSVGGQEFDTYADPRSREPFTNNTKFKSAVFTPVKPIDIQVLTQAIKNYEHLTGSTVSDVEKNAVATAARAYAAEELKSLFPVGERVRARRLPVLETIEEYRAILDSMASGSAEECISVLAGGVATLEQGRGRARRIADCLSDQGLLVLEKAALAADEMTPVLSARGDAEAEAKGGRLRELLDSKEFYEGMPEIDSITRAVAARYQELYAARHSSRAEQYESAISRIRNRDEWNRVPDSMREAVLQPLASRACSELDQHDGGLSCRVCHSGIAEMEADIEALGARFARVVSDVQRLTTPRDVRIERVRIAEFLQGSLESADQVRAAVTRLQEHLLKLLDEGVKIIVE
jgi:hypothetical protein